MRYLYQYRDTELAVLPDGLLNTIKRHFPQVPCIYYLLILVIIRSVNIRVMNNAGARFV